MKVGIDIGGSHIGVGLVNHGKLTSKKEKDIILVSEDIEKNIIDDIVNLTNQLLEENKEELKNIELIGIASPGTVTKTSIVRAENLKLKDFEIVKLLQEYFNTRIYLNNDAKAAALAEKRYGSLKEYNNAIFMTLGTGIGGAVFINGEMLKPKKFPGLEIGHMVIDKNGKQCNCGRIGCFETCASMKGFKENIKQALGIKIVKGSVLKDIIIEKKEQPEVEEIINNYIADLSTGICNLINIFEPEAISIGGSFVYYEDLFLDKLKNLVGKKNATYNHSTPEIVLAQFANDAGIIGATCGN